MADTLEQDEFNNDKDTRDTWMRLILSNHKWVKEQFAKEADKYIKAYRHQFRGIDAYVAESNRVDVNIVFQVVKSLIPNLYFKDPQVFVRVDGEEKVNRIPVMETVEVANPETGELQQAEQQSINPETGEPMFKEYDLSKSAKKFETTINKNIKKAKLKYEVKDAILDAHLSFYGAVKDGFGNDQGIAEMGEGAPPSVNLEQEDQAYGIRLKPWDVVPDCLNFYKPYWVAVKYCVPVEQLKNDNRLDETARNELKGITSVSYEKTKDQKDLSDPSLKYVEYFELFVKPCAKYPNGLFAMVTEEYKDGFLYKSDFPNKVLPVKFLYFNRDPRGGLPIPDVRYYIGHQTSKNDIRNAGQEYVQRSLPILVINKAALNQQETAYKQVTSGQVPRVLTGNQPPNRIAGGVNFPSLGSDFYNFDATIDSDVAKVTGLLTTVTPNNDPNQLAVALKIGASGEQVRNNERADIVSDFIQSIVQSWAEYYQKFSGDEEFLGNFSFELKPFSMSYEDPMILRKQWVDLLNLLGSPELRAALAQQGIQVNMAQIVKKILETYDERDVSAFITDMASTPENQVLDALQENAMLVNGQGMGVQVLPTDNDKIHILIHQLLGEVGAEHIQQHAVSMQQKMNGSTAGGGNVEGLPTNGVAANQELLNTSPSPSAANTKVAGAREAYAS